MHIYKKASIISFSNIENLKLKIKKMRDTEFAAYISVLSQMHEDLDNGIELEESAIEQAGESNSKNILNFINDIGISNFESYDFDEISNALSSLKNEINKPKESELPGLESPEDFEVPKESGIFDLEKILTLNPKARIDYLNSLDYAPRVKQNAKIVIDNLSNMEAILAEGDIPEGTKKFLQKEISSGILTLLELAKEPEDLKEDLPLLDEDGNEIIRPDNKVPEELKPKGPRLSRKSESKLIAYQSISVKPEEFNILEEELFNEESLKNNFSSNNNFYIDFSTEPPTVKDEIENVVSKFLTSLENIKRKLFEKGDVLSLQKELNKLIYSVKFADTSAYRELLKRKQNSSPEHHVAYKNIEHRILYESPSAKILDDDFFSTLYFISLALGSPNIARVLLFNDDRPLIDSAEKTKVILESDYGGVKEAIEEKAMNTIRSKTKTFFDLSINVQENNYIEYIGLKWKILFSHGVEKYLGKAPGYEMKPCPTCYKMVPWISNDGFRVRNFSYFTNDPNKPKITLDELNSRKWPALKSSFYSREREQQLADKYTREGMKSWAEIQDLLASNIPEKHEEGWHRRNGALYEAGGIPLSTRDVYIKKTFSECPFGPEQKSGCGVLYSEKSAYTGLNKGLNLQPQWNLIKDVGAINTEAVDTLIEDVWTDKELFSKAKKRQAGGYKFSKINFACTCRIQNIDADCSFKHGMVAISKSGAAGSPDFIPPTLPNGTLDENIEESTLAYMVCGAPTSLSSFDRNPSSFGYILSYLKRLADSNFNDYRATCMYLLQSGIDVQDLMELDFAIENYKEDKITTTSQERINKLSQILKQAAIKINTNSDIRKYLGGITLVCPFGHRFTIEHSLKFGEAYTGIFQSERSVKDFFPIITSLGFNNVQALIKSGNLIKAENLIGFSKILPYKEWKKYPNGTVFPDFKDKKRPILMFSIPIDIDGTTNDYVLGHKGFGWKSNIWSSEESFDSPRIVRVNLERDASAKRAVSDFAMGSEGEILSVIDVDVASRYNEDEDENEEDDSGFIRKPTKSIPGASALEDENGQINIEALNERIASFSRALISTLRIIITWTKGAASESMLNAMLLDYQVNLSPNYSRIIVDNLVKKQHLHLQDPDGNPVSKDYKIILTREIEDDILKRLNDKTNSLYDWIRSNVSEIEPDPDFDLQIAVTLLSSILRDFNDPNPDIGFNSPSGGEAAISRENFEAFAKNFSLGIMSSNPGLVNDLTFKSPNYTDYVRTKVQYNSRVALISYAQYLANILRLIYNKYCKNPKSPYYIGYNINIDLSTINNILGYNKNGEWIGGITNEEIDEIPKDYAEASRQPNAFKKIKSQTLHYGYRIDMAWNDLENYLAQSKSYITSNKAMVRAKDYLMNKFESLDAIKNGSNYSLFNMRDRVAAVFPSRALYFKGTTTNPEGGIRFGNKRRLPYIARTNKRGNFLTFDQIPGYQENPEYLVRNKLSGKIYAFDKQTEAEQFLKQLIEEKPNENQDWSLEPDPYYTNDNKGFDSRKTQIGMFSPKNDKDLLWPPEIDDMEFVGIIPPFDVPDKATDNSISKSQDVPFLSYKFEILFEGDSLDITPLIKKGRTVDDLKKIEKMENVIIEAAEELKKNIVLFAQENAAEISKNPRIAQEYKAQEIGKYNELTRQIISEIQGMFPYLTTSVTYVSPPDYMEGRRMIKFVLENPIRAYKIIKNPSIRGIILSQDEQKALINFIIKVFNIDTLAKCINSMGETVSPIELLDKPEKYKKIVNKAMKKDTFFVGDEEFYGWKHDVGNYFELIPGDSESDNGSYIQYVYQTQIGKNLGQGEIDIKFKNKQPNMKDFVNIGMAAKKYGIGETSLSNNEYIQKIENDMLNYIKTRTSGERKNHVKDFKRKNSEYIENIQKRKGELDKIILSMGLKFDDVEFPNF